jgi:hypothetical protein
VLGTLNAELLLGLALLAFHSQRNLLCGLRLLVENGLGLSAESSLLLVVSPLALGEKRGLASLVLGHLVKGVLPALLALAEGLSLLGNVNHLCVEKEGVRSGCNEESINER